MPEKKPDQKKHRWAITIKADPIHFANLFIFMLERQGVYAQNRSTLIEKTVEFLGELIVRRSLIKNPIRNRKDAEQFIGTFRKINPPENEWDMSMF